MNDKAEIASELVQHKVLNFGCRLNMYEGECIKNIISENCLNKNTVVVNSCAVTNESEKHVKQAIRKIKKKSPQVDIVVVGCAVDLNPRDYLSIEGVSKVISNSKKLDPQSYQSSEKIVIGNASQETHKPIEKFDHRTRAFVKVQDGCNHSCTFCSTTISRGPSRSIPIHDIVKQVEILVNNGHKEIVLTGIDMSDYGSDIGDGTSLASMVKRLINLVPDLQRLRLSSLDVAEFDSDLISIVSSSEKIMPHIHLSVQSGDNMILKRMKRRHSVDEIYNVCNKLRYARPGIVFGADIIAGFPTENEAMFQNTIDMINQIGFTHLHVFTYSPRPQTVASKMPQVPYNIRKHRSKVLRQLSQKITSEYNRKQINKEYNVLFESNFSGYAENFITVRTDEKMPIGEIVKIKIVDYNAEKELIGVPSGNQITI